ncbi:MAG: acyl carrier protein [bacterium]|nr:acyl carrier protein [bacterium]
MTQEEIYEMIKYYFVEQFEVPQEKISFSAKLFEELGLDSIDALDMIGMLEEKLNIEIDEEKIKNIRTVKDVVDYVSSIIPASA